MAKKLYNLAPNEFWREISNINNSRTLLPTSISDATGEKEITKQWKNHFESLFNCLQNLENQSLSKISDSSFNNIKVTPFEVKEAIKKLKDNKSSGENKIYAEHIRSASDRLIPLISICFTVCFVHRNLRKLIAIVQRRRKNLKK